MRPCVGCARRLMVRSSVDLPAPDRPITPTKPPGAMENDALSTAAFVPKRHVKPSTTSMPCSSAQLAPPLAPVFNSYVTAALHCGDRPHRCRLSRLRHAIVIKPLDDVHAQSSLGIAYGD